MGFFDTVHMAPPDPIFGLLSAFEADKRQQKVFLSIGVYKTSDLKTPILKSVKKAEALLVEDEKTKEYLPIDGDKQFIDLTGSLVFGKNLWAKEQHRIHGSQTLGGTGALRVGGDFYKQEVGKGVYVSDPTWSNHPGVFSSCGLKIESYPYYDKKKHTLEFSACCHFLKTLPPGSLIILHASCHNPTGAGLSLTQWEQLSSLFLEKRLIPFFDSAYQGFDVSLEKDTQAIRLFLEAGHEMFVAASFSKNFGLYAERIGALFLVTSSEEIAKKVGSNVKRLIRRNYSNPPMHGAHVVGKILSLPSLRKEWEEELSHMRSRIIEMREAFATALSSKSTKFDFSFLNQRSGLFSFCGLEKHQVQRLLSEYGVYMTEDGRINVAGLNQNNLDYVVNAILKCIE